MDAVEILAEAGIHLSHWRCGQHYLPCPRCSTRKSDRNLSVLVTPEGHGKWKCWRCGDFSGSTEALAKKAAWEQRRGAAAASKGRNQRGPPPSPQGTADGPGAHAQPRPHDPAVKPVPPAPGEVPEHVPFGPQHREFWLELDRITADCPVGRYLADRGCVVPDACHLRWHPDFGYLGPGSWRGPVMIGLITDVLTCRPMSFHFTWVRPDGHGKAPLERPRMLARGMAKQGGVIRLCDEADLNAWLMVGEGVESMLSAQRLTGMPQAWAAVDAGNLGKMPIPDWLRQLVIVADHDKPNPRTGKRAGLQAASDLIDRCIAARTVHEVEVIYPPQEGWDANDMLLARRRAQGVA
jgi:hypothetical protein